MDTVTVNGDALTVEELVAVARGERRAVLGADVAVRMAHSRAVVASAVEQGRIMYGITTGFGALADTHIGRGDIERTQLALVRSHAAAVGEPLDDATVRALLLLRARTLAAGVSGVRVDLPRRLLELLDRDLLPIVPGKGSVGASGDLAQLAHLALPLVGEGRLRRGGTTDPVGRPSAELLAEEGLEPLTLAPKEGLSLINGTEPMQALLALAVADAEVLVRAADIACAMSVEALLGTDRPYDQRVQALRPHPGQLASASNLRALLRDSPLLASHRESTHAVQDCYSLRCAPQVHGAVRDVLAHAERVLDIELGAVVDNPVIIGGRPESPGGPGSPEIPVGPGSTNGPGGPESVDGADVMTTGNFHGEPLAFAADMLAMALAELASISERRTDRLLDPAYSRGLPPFLAREPGTNSGYMLAQYTAASLVSENKVLAHPASVDTIPTSGNQEDHVSMGWTSARKLGDVVSNVRTVLAVELLCAAQGVDERAAVARPGPAISAVHSRLRKEVAAMETDRCVGDQITTTDRILPDLVAAAAAVTGGLG
jgi:histidine ammonia-lyase